MKNIFIGLLLIILDFNLTLGSSSIEILPDFIGYIYVYMGMKEITMESEWFRKLLPFSVGMAVYTAIIFVIDLIGINTSSGLPFYLVLGLISTVIYLYIVYGIIMGIMDMEVKNEWDLYSEPLFSAWKVIAVSSALIMILLFILPIVSVIGAIVLIIAGIYFLISFNRTKNAYYSRF